MASIDESKCFYRYRNNEFSMTDIKRKVEMMSCQNPSEVIEDLSKVIRFVDSGSKMFVQKEYDTHSKAWPLVFVNNTWMKDSLKMIKLWKEENKTIAAYDIMLAKLTVKGVAFNSFDKDLLSIFHGDNYNIWNKVIYNIMKIHLK